jgi:hypothetical protein
MPGWVALADHVFIAGTLALVEQPGANPPNKRMKPEDRFDDHVETRQEIVAAPHVA